MAGMYNGRTSITSRCPADVVQSSQRDRSLDRGALQWQGGSDFLRLLHEWQVSKTLWSMMMSVCCTRNLYADVQVMSPSRECDAGHGILPADLEWTSRWSALILDSGHAGGIPLSLA